MDQALLTSFSEFLKEITQTTVEWGILIILLFIIGIVVLYILCSR